MKRAERQEMEQVRIRAVSGLPVRQVARAFGVSRVALYSWMRTYEAGGFEALRARKAPGQSPKLTVTQMTKLRTMILGSDPRQLGFELALWTREMVALLIARELGVTMSLSAVGRMLRKLGMSPQRPLWRAYQADPDVLERWKTTEYPSIRAEAAKEDAVIFFADEAESARTTTRAGPGEPSARPRWCLRPGLDTRST